MAPWPRRMLAITAVVVSISIVLLPRATVGAAAVTRYVSTTGTDAPDCSNPVSPCLTINYAISQAAAGDTIEVAEGTYTGSGGNAVASFTKSLFLSGGWDATFAAQAGMSVIDGENARGGVYLGYTSAVAQISRFAIVRGRADKGAGVHTWGTVMLENVTISGNNATSWGGGVYLDQGSAQLITLNVTIAHNTSPAGGGVMYQNPYATITLHNTIVAANVAPSGPDCYGQIDAADHSIFGTACTVAAGSDNQFSTDPQITAYLVGAGYHPLLPGSPAIDAADAVSAPAVDQRGVSRPQDAAPDIGSYEYVATPGTAATFGVAVGSHQQASPSTAFGAPLGLYVVDSLGSPVSGVAATFTAPASGPSGTFAGTGTNNTTANTDSGGLAITDTFTANSESGNYNVNAVASGLPGSVDFVLTNALWYVATAGSDSNSCLSPADPCLTINGAINKAGSGQAIFVEAGTYAGTGTNVVDVTKSLDIRGGWDSSFNSQIGSSIIDGQGLRRGMAIAGGIAAVLENFTIRNGSTPSHGGAGIYSSGQLTLRNTTVTGNTAASGGGGIFLWFNAGLTLQNTTIANNHAGSSGGGISDSSSGPIIVQNSIIANNTTGQPEAPSDCYGTINSSDHSVIGSTVGCTVAPGPGDQFNVDPLISAYPVGIYGYHALLSGSPAIDAGDPATCLAIDQRGLARPQGGVCDEGSYEFVSSPGAAVSFGYAGGSPQRTSVGADYPKLMGAYVVDSLGTAVGGVGVTFAAPASGPSGTFGDTGTTTTTATTDSGGLALASTFSANDEAGTYVVQATASGLGDPIDFTLTNYAWFVSTAGSDVNACDVPEAPCLTIQGALGKASAGDKLRVAAGTYTSAYSQVVYLAKSVELSGGWDASFTSQTGETVIDGEGARQGINISSSVVTAVVDRFTILHGNAYSGGGIDSSGNLLLRNSTIRDNSASNGGAGAMLGGTTVIENSTISDNSGPWPGGGIYTNGNLILRNSTISGNSGGSGGGIYAAGGNIDAENTTISNNTGSSGGGIFDLTSGSITLRNSILANNKITALGPDCRGSVVSAGYNLVGNSADCTFAATTGDQVGTSAAPLEPWLLRLSDNGGPTFTHALMDNSPALNAGNPATPGSGGDACLAMDQRGVTRPQEGTCDTGAFEGQFSGVMTILRAGPHPTGLSSVDFAVAFSAPVTGVDVSDFSLTTTGLAGASVSSLTGNDAAYTVTVQTGSGNGTIRLDLVDDDTILNEDAVPLGGPGLGNADYSSGQVYTIKKIPTLMAPKGFAWDRTPTYKWRPVPDVTEYKYQLRKGTTVIYTRSGLPSGCTATQCTRTPSTTLNAGNYRWRARDLIEGVWQPWSPSLSFTIVQPKAGLWEGDALEFYVVPSRTRVDDFAVYVNVYGCGSYKLTHRSPVNIHQEKFGFTGSYYADGEFDATSLNSTSAHGSIGLDQHFITGCGYVSGGPFGWTASWVNNSQPADAAAKPVEPIVIDERLSPEGALPFTVTESP